MDRQIVYAGAIPLDTDLLSTQRSTMIALGYLAQAALGTNVVADGLACVPTQPPSLGIVVGPGSITQMGTIDTTAFGSLPADTTDPLLRMGINTQPTPFTLTAPTVPGQAINYLVEASLLESDGGAVVLPYYNAASPGQPYSGPNNTGISQNTQRLQRVQLQVKAGAPAAAGQQSTPSADAGWSGLYVVTVTYGQTAINAAGIAAMPTAPFVPTKLPQLSPGVRNLASFTPTTQGRFVVPAGVTALRVRLWGGGGGGGGGFGGAGGGGSAGGYSEGYYVVAPGQSFQVTVGNGGVAPNTPGGTTSFGALASAAGGSSGGSGSSGVAAAGGTTGGGASSSGLALSGSPGGGALQSGSNYLGGAGGGTFGSTGTPGVSGSGSATVNGPAGVAPGAGGAGGVGGGAGGLGGSGLALVEW